MNASIYPRNTGPHTEPVQVETGPAVIHTADGYIHLAKESQSDIVRDVATNQLELQGGIQASERAGGRLHLGCMVFGIFGRKQQGTGQIAGLYLIEIDQNQLFHPKKHQILEHLIAQSATSDHQDTGCLDAGTLEPRELVKDLFVSGCG